jgi:hypothetical protein
MQVKLLLSLISLLGLIVVILSRKYPLKSLFWFGIFLLWIRQISFPIIETLNLSFLIFTILVLINPSILLSKINFKEWRIWYLVLLIGVLNALIFGIQKDFFVGTNILSKSFDWSVKFFVIIFVSSCITHYVKTKKELNRLLNLFLWSCFIFSFTSVIAYFGFYDGVVIYGSGSLTDGFIQDLNRDNIYSEIYGISSSNLVFGVSSLGIVFIPYLNWEAWKKYLFFILLVFAVIISLKRLAIISLILSLFYFLIIEKKKGNNIWILVIPILVFSVGTNYYDLIYKRFFSALSSINTSEVIDSSSNTRLDRYNLAWQSFLDAPLFGQGAGYLIYIHNGFLEILANLGLTGLVLFKPIIKPLMKIKRSFNNPWAIAIIILMLSLVLLEAAINRVEIMYFVGLLYGGFLASKNIEYKTF